MALDNMTGITKGSYTGFCKSQLITCNFVKACNGVCPFEDALKHADKEIYEHTDAKSVRSKCEVEHDRDWIIGCIEHDGFVHTHRFDKANQIILDALSAEPSGDLISRADAIEAVAGLVASEYVVKDGEHGFYTCASVAQNVLSALPSADAEPKRVLQGYNKGDNTIQTIRHEELTQIANTRKAVESADAVQGEWIPCTKEGLPLTELGRREGQKWYGYKCSKCNFIYKGNALNESPFCQNCWARMKGGAE